MSSGAEALDHVGVVGRDLTELADAFERLGFLVTPVARHPGGRTGNRCVMLRQGYIELISVLPGGASETLDRFLARYAGVHVLALAVVDEAATVERLRRAGIGQASLSHTGRAVDDAEPGGLRARFALITTPDPPEGRVNLVRHLTPEALWQERFLHHPNHASALVEVVLAVPRPAETAAYLSRLAGRPVVPDAASGYALTLPRGCIRLLPPAALASVFAGTLPPMLPWIAGMTLHTDDGNAALLGLLHERELPYRVAEDAVLVEGGGATLRFAYATGRNAPCFSAQRHG